MKTSELRTLAITVLLLDIALMAVPEAGRAGNVNACPIVTPLSISVSINGTVNFQLPATDPDMDPLQFLVVQAPAHGTLVVQAQTGAASYSPAPGYCGPDSFSFTATDTSCMPPAAAVAINVFCTAPTPTPTVTATPTQTPTNTPLPLGASCLDGAECASTFCVAGVCCESACDALNQFCNLSGSEGVCVTPETAPTMSPSAVAVAGLMFIALGAFALRRRT